MEPQADKRRAQTISNVLKACDRVASELKGTTLTDDEFQQLSEKLNNMAKMIYSQRSERSQAATVAFHEALHTLRQLRK